MSTLKELSSLKFCCISADLLKMPDNLNDVFHDDFDSFIFFHFLIGLN